MRYTQMNLRSGRMAQVRRKEESRLKGKKIKHSKNLRSKGRRRGRCSMGWMFE